MVFRGSLVELPLTDILQLVAVSSKTGVLNLRNGEGRGEIHVDKGRIVHAATGALSGEQAFYELARWLTGEFDFTQDIAVGPQTVTTSNTNLMLEAARQIDEWKLLAKRIGSTRMVLVFAPVSSTSVTLTGQEWAVVSRVDERRNIEEIALALGQSAFDVCKVVHGLLTSGTMALREDLRRLPIDRVRRLSSEEQNRLAVEIHRTATGLLAGQPDRAADLDAALRLYRAEHESGRTLDALLDLVREDEKIVSGSLGPHQASAFLERVAALLSGAEVERPAARAPEPTPRAAKPVPDLKKVRVRLAELTYQGLGPEGESHVLKIERAKNAEELLRCGIASRDLLRRIGREDVAEALNAELEALS